MGTDKAFLDFNGESLLTRALRVMSEACGTVKVLGDPARFGAANYETIEDIFPESGPLGGIHAALTGSSSDLNSILAVDMPYVTTDLLRFLLGAAAIGVATVTVPRVGGRVQPLCAIYRREFAVAAETALRAEHFKIDAVFAAVKTQVVEEDELLAAGFSARDFFNMNSPEDFLSQQ